MSIRGEWQSPLYLFNLSYFLFKKETNMNVVNKMSRINYEVFISFICESNRVDDNWNIEVENNGNSYLGNNITIRDILLTSDEVVITHTFQNNDRITIDKSFDKFTLYYQGSGKHLREYDGLIDKIVEGSETITSTRLNTRSTFRHLSSSE